MEQTGALNGRPAASRHPVTDRELRILRGLREGRDAGRITLTNPISAKLIALWYESEFHEEIRAKDVPTYAHTLREAGYPVGISPAGGYFYALSAEEGEYTRRILRSRAFSSFRALAGFVKSFSNERTQDDLGQMYLDLTAET